MKSAADLIEEARSYGLDVEAERCDLLLLRADLMILRALDDPLRGLVVERLNGGYPLPSLPVPAILGLIDDLAAIRESADESEVVRAIAQGAAARLERMFEEEGKPLIETVWSTDEEDGDA